MMRGCADRETTWISEEIIISYEKLFELGYAHAVECWEDGIGIGGAFFGESMFSRATDASKVALVALVPILREHGFGLLDCQMETAHMNAFGARNHSRLDFEQRLAQTIDKSIAAGAWSLPATCGGLL